MKPVFLFLLISLMLVSACNSCNNKEGSKGDVISENLDEKITIPDDFDKVEYKMPNELQYGRIGKEFLYDKFYPIGWSKDGKFAYLIEPADEGSGLYWFEAVIFDMVNNKVSWSWKPAESENGSLSKTWQENYNIFKKEFSEAGIIQVNMFEIKASHVNYKGNDYELLLETKNITDPDFGFEVLSEIKVNLVSDQLGNKTIANLKEGEYSRVTGAIISGFLLSPFDDRILVICQKDRVGYEGPPNVVYFQLIGSDLVRGFKKDKES